MTTATEVKTLKSKLADIKTGDKLSVTYYLTVLNKNSDSLDVEDQTGSKFAIRGKDLIEETINTAEQYTETRKISRTELIEVLENAGDTVFTANFNKLPNAESIAELLGSYSINDFSDTKKLSKIAKEVMKGEGRNLKGYLLNTEPKMGRSSVIDLEVPKGQHNVRLIDHRTLNFLILKGIRYEVK
jgi:hypothetical protein